MENVVSCEVSVISISSGRLNGIKSVGFYISDKWHVGLFYLPLIKNLRKRYPIYLYGLEGISGLKEYLKINKVHIFTLPERISFMDRLKLRRQLPHPDVLIVPEDAVPIHLGLIHPGITIGSGDGFTISLNGEGAFDNLLKLLDADKPFPEKTSKRKKGIYIPGVNKEGFRYISHEGNLGFIGRLYTIPSLLAGKAYIMGIRVSLIVKDKNPMLPSDVEQLVYSEKPEDVLDNL